MVCLFCSQLAEGNLFEILVLNVGVRNFTSLPHTLLTLQGFKGYNQNKCTVDAVDSVCIYFLFPLL